MRARVEELEAEILLVSQAADSRAGRPAAAVAEIRVQILILAASTSPICSKEAAADARPAAAVARGGFRDVFSGMFRRRARRCG